eukprot:scaffold1240_cov101-Isochrysis_galbana.AAC.12
MGGGAGPAGIGGGGLRAGGGGLPSDGGNNASPNGTGVSSAAVQHSAPTNASRSSPQVDVAAPTCPTSKALATSTRKSIADSARHQAPGNSLSEGCVQRPTRGRNTAEIGWGVSLRWAVPRTHPGLHRVRLAPDPPATTLRLASPPRPGRIVCGARTRAPGDGHACPYPAAPASRAALTRSAARA